MLNQVIIYSRQTGQMETRVNQLSTFRNHSELPLPNDWKHDDIISPLHFEGE